jgi:hypothetical protein
MSIKRLLIAAAVRLRDWRERTFTPTTDYNNYLEVYETYCESRYRGVFPR